MHRPPMLLRQTWGMCSHKWDDNVNPPSAKSYDKHPRNIRRLHFEYTTCVGDISALSLTTHTT